MTVESLIFDALKTLVSNRVFPDVAPPESARPYITYQQIGGAPVNFIDGGIPSKRNGRFQINVWSDTRLAASELAIQVETALRGVSVLQTSVLGSVQSIYEPDTNLRGAIQDFSFWY